MTPLQRPLSLQATVSSESIICNLCLTLSRECTLKYLQEEAVRQVNEMCKLKEILSVLQLLPSLQMFSINSVTFTLYC